MVLKAEPITVSDRVELLRLLAQARIAFPPPVRRHNPHGHFAFASSPKQN
jgi:hypothetical protein